MVLPTVILISVINDYDDDLTSTLKMIININISDDDGCGDNQ